jgi:membrane protease YdiL (CAAX protease family)
MGVEHEGTDGDSDWPPAFEGGIETVTAFVLLFAVLLAAVNLALTRVLGPDPEFVARQLGGIPWKLTEIGIAVAFLRYEDVSLRDIGLDPRLLRPGLAVAVALVAGVNAIAIALVLAAGEPLAVGFFADLRAPPLNVSTTEVLVGAVSFYLFTAPAEELAFRGYLQNKLVALLGERVRLGRALGILSAGLLFAVAHVPTLLADGAGPTELVASLAVLAFTGIGFGLVYALTRNLYLVIVMHAVGNWWPLFVEIGAWPNWPLVTLLYVMVVLGYRYWAVEPTGRIRGVSV